MGVEGEAGGVDESGEQDVHFAVGIDLEDGDGSLLAASSGEGDEDFARRVDGRVGDSVNIFGEQAGDVHIDLVAAAAVAEDLETGGLLCGFGDADDEAIVAREQDGSSGSSDSGERALQCGCAEVCAADFNFAAGQRGVGQHGFDAGVVGWVRSEESDHDSRLLLL